MRKTILAAAAAILTLSPAVAFAESDNATLQSLRQQQAVEANEAGASSFGLSDPAASTTISTADSYAQPIGSGAAATELRRMTYGD